MKTFTQINKTLVYAAMAITALLTSAGTAEARSMKRYDIYEISDMQLDPKSVTVGDSIHRITGGRLKVDYAKKTMTLHLDVSNECPPGLFCIARMYAPIIIKTENLVVSSGFCGGYFLTAFKDQRPVDGLRYDLNVYVPTLNRCGPTEGEDAIQINLTEQGNMFGAGEYYSQSTFQSAIYKTQK